MKPEDIVYEYWSGIAGQDWDSVAGYFKDNAVIRWHNTNECFTADEFIACNSSYPGKWSIIVESVLQADNALISIVKVYNNDISFHSVSVFEFDGNKIKTLDEYWGEDGAPPQWRKDMNIGRPLI